MTLSWQHVLAFLFAVGLLVTVHEFGHYWVARKLGFKVLRFSVGFGKALYTRVAGADRTEYVIAALPLGGYVKLLDEREAPVAPEEVHRAFNRKPHWQRILVLVAGPAFNIVFAVLLLAAMFWINGVSEVRAVVGTVVPDSVAARAGLASEDEILTLDGVPVAGQGDVVLGLLDQMTGDGRAELSLRSAAGAERTLVLEVADPAQRRALTEPENLLRGLGFSFWFPPVPTVVGQVEEGGAAALAGLRAGDEVRAVNGTPVSDFQTLRQRIEALADQEVLLTIRRQGADQGVRIQVKSSDENGRRVGRIGVGPQRSVTMPESMFRHESPGPLRALGLGTVKAWDMTVLQAKVVWRMLQGNVSLKNLSGPLSIMEVAGDSAKSGVAPFISFLVLISLSLGFLNLLPVPVLDGGQIVFQLVEWIKGSPLSERAQVLGQQVGIAVLMLMMGIALFNDVSRQFG